MKQCKQCGRTLDESNFRKTKSRSKGIYKNTKQGTKTICRSCESLNVRVYQALKANDTAALETLREHYKTLSRLGHPPVTAAARQLLAGTGVEITDMPQRNVNEVLSITSSLGNEVLEHAYKVRNRSYSCVDEADAVHRRLESQLKELDLYEEITNLLDDWYMDE